MLGQYLPIAVMAVLATVFAALSFAASKLLAPHRPTPEKLQPYECGIVESTDPPRRFPVRFYLVAMIFVIFDIEIIFLYPWSVLYRRLGTLGLVEVVLFAVPVFVSFLYLLSEGALDWGPAKRAGRSPLVSEERTAGTTIRRVGLEGRPPSEEAA